MKRAVLDFWFELASSYSYPAAMRIAPLAEARGVAVRWRPFLLGPIFKSQGWTTSPFNIYSAKGRNMWRDLERICSGMGLVFARPQIFPQNAVLAARLALVGLQDGWGEDYVRSVYLAEFGHGRDIGDAAVLAEILEQLGQNSATTIERARSVETKSRLRESTEEAQRLGIFGSPSFVAADGELFWGNDRLEPGLEWATRLRSCARASVPHCGQQAANTPDLR
ncbi:MAG TPA: 2-hydroxychromene-2-carboxylate isomerase [Pseudolabrys sp.]|nr:2-hydroxychromene-2-carboxylate isomerase [Pseudolabrys sp.]